MADYWTARRARFIRNQFDLIVLACKVIKIDPSVEIYVHRDYHKRFLDAIVFIKGEKINEIAFHDVPYRWSGCGYEENWQGNYHSGGPNHKMPFNENDVLTTFHPIVSKAYNNKQQFLKYCFWLVKINPQDILNDLLFSKLNPEE